MTAFSMVYHYYFYNGCIMFVCPLSYLRNQTVELRQISVYVECVFLSTSDDVATSYVLPVVLWMASCLLSHSRPNGTSCIFLSGARISRNSRNYCIDSNQLSVSDNNPVLAGVEVCRQRLYCLLEQYLHRKPSVAVDCV